MKDCNDPALKHGTVRSGDVSLHVTECGDGPGVLMLHGFPDFWYSWRRQASAVSAAGHRAVMPDLRGYGRSDRPPAVRNYRTELLVDDAAAIIAARCDGRCTVVGHDWGGVIAWHLAMARPDLVEKLVILNAPHPAQYRYALLHSAQLLRSWYVFAVQPPWLPERLLAARDSAWLKRTLTAAGLAEHDVACYQEAFDSAECFRGPLNYYRAAARAMVSGSSVRERAGAAETTAHRDATGRDAASTPLGMPVTVIWGEKDPYLDSALLDGLDRHVRDLRIERVPDASHFVHWERPERVNGVLREVLTS